jgi:hypothetical protein
MHECTAKAINLGGPITSAELRFIDETPYGLYFEHTCLGSEASPGYIPFEGEGAGAKTWKIEQLEPLTLSPSLLCPRCKLHGHVRGGKWVPA